MRRFKECKVGRYLRVSEVKLGNKQTYDHEDLQRQNIESNFAPSLVSPQIQKIILFIKMIHMNTLSDVQ
jgi:hypothetical protein